MSISPYKLKNGEVRWRAREWDPFRRRWINVSAGHTSERKAKASHKEWIEAGGRRHLEPRQRMTVAHWRDRWLEVADIGDSTRAHYRQQTARFVEQHGARRLTAIDRLTCVEWAKAHPRDAAPLSAMWSAAIEAELLHDDSPWRGLVRKFPGRDLPPGWLLAADVDRLIALPPAVLDGLYGLMWSALLALAADTGLRPGEIAGLRWTDLQPADGLIHVQRQANGLTRTFTLPKHGSTRFVVYPERAQRLVAAMPRLHDQQVFASVRGRVLWPEARARSWHRINAAFGRPDMDLYELRHFCATRLLELGLSAGDVATQLGHQDGGKLVLKTYGHPRTDPALNRIRAAITADDRDAQEATA